MSFTSNLGRLWIALLATVLALALAACGTQAVETPAAAKAPVKTVAAVHAPYTENPSKTIHHTLLRRCPYSVDYSDSYEKANYPGCDVLAHLADGTHVSMRCWTDSNDDSRGTPQKDDGTSFGSPRWFYVTVNGKGMSGYVYSQMVKDQKPDTPECTAAILRKYPTPKVPDKPVAPSAEPSPYHFAIVGSCTTAGGALTAKTSGFDPGHEYWITANYPDGREYKNLKTKTTADRNGSIRWNWPCKGDPPGVYTTTIFERNALIVGPVEFTVGKASEAAPPPPPPPATYSEYAGGTAHTWSDYRTAGGRAGQTIASHEKVQISCRLTGFKVANGNTWWYRIASAPWNNDFYVSADAFYNNGQTSGSLQGTPYFDPAVPVC